MLSIFTHLKTLFSTKTKTTSKYDAKAKLHFLYQILNKRERTSSKGVGLPFSVRENGVACSSKNVFYKKNCEGQQTSQVWGTSPPIWRQQIALELIE